MRLVSRNRRRFRVPGGTRDLRRAFSWLQSRYPK
jgi:hypothetical protein